MKKQWIEETESENETIRERYELAMERIEEIIGEAAQKLELKYALYFIKTAAFLLQVKEVASMAENKEIQSLPLEALQQLNYGLYQDLMNEEDRIREGDKIEKLLKDAGREEIITVVSEWNIPERKELKQDSKMKNNLEAEQNSESENSLIQFGYEYSYANPDYATEKLGEEYGRLLCFLYTELRGTLVYAYERRLFDITIALELFIEIYNLMQQKEEEDEETILKWIKDAVYYYISDYCDVTMPRRIREQLDPTLSFATDIIMESDLNDIRYLYYFGEYISENEIKTAQFLNTLPQEEIDKMASTYTEGFREGFVHAGIDLSKKKNVNIRYNIGFERVVRAAICRFRNMGLEPVIYRAAVSSIHKKQHLKIGYCSTGVNRQYDYDHRFDDGIYLDKGIAERKLVNLRVAYEQYAELAKVYAGPAVMEIFGEKPFEPVDKKSATKFTDKQQKISVSYQRDASIVTNEYIKSDEYSFTIIAYPIPEIGEEFEKIFAETVKVNTLDMKKYEEIQKKIIDVLDQGIYVKVKGMGKNHTDIKVMLHRLENPEKETNFENCLADVNIPVGEVFTSPKLTGTEGVLHVSEVYLNELKYRELELQFKDGIITEYTCKNFHEEDANKAFVKENLMYQRDFLPIGEFAIGTNTTAYQMGRKFQISHRLPILIAEKTGPHFAVGDTCYKMSEEQRIYNPDGKEIVAKDNEYSILRKTEVEKAYFNCHTDITIPYDELGEISVYKENGESVAIIQNGRFVLEGTEELNEALEVI